MDHDALLALSDDDFAREVEAARVRVGTTVTALAEHAGISRQTYINVQGGARPSARVRVGLARALDELGGLDSDSASREVARLYGRLPKREQRAVLALVRGLTQG